MAVGHTKTLLPLDEFARIIGLHPLHFNGVAVANMPVCSKTLTQYTWQSADAVSREEIAIAISEAEAELSGYLGFHISPTWITDERVDFSRSNSPELIYANQAIKTRWGHVISGGIEQKTLIQSGAAIVYTDADSDGYKETATIVVMVPANLEPEQVAIYYPNSDAVDEWEVRPITVSNNGGVATITCKREQLTTPELLSVLNPATIEGLTDANFLTEVDVYRHYNDPQLQAELMWHNWCGSCYGDTGCGTCVYDTQSACLHARDYRLGMFYVTPATWNVDTQQFDAASCAECTVPERIRTWYYAGFRATNTGSMDPLWAHAVAKLALTKLDRPICSCHSVAQAMERWTIDLRHSVGTAARSSAYRVTAWELENCPFGATPAGLDVWRLARRFVVHAS